MGCLYSAHSQKGNRKPFSKRFPLQFLLQFLMDSLELLKGVVLKFFQEFLEVSQQKSLEEEFLEFLNKF